MLDFNELKKSRALSIQKLTADIEKTVKSKEANYDDDRFWYPAVDKTGNGSAIIRFLPAPKGDDHAFVRLWTHSFKGPTGLWYIENSLTTIGQSDPCGDLNSKLWNSGSEEAKKQARDQKRKLMYITNILIVKDPANPENEGKVKLFRYGKKIQDKISDKLSPTFEDEVPMNPFDLWSGANFKLRISQVDGYRNYDKSEFANSTTVSDNDAELEKIWNSEYSLKEFNDPKNFKPYDVLKAKLDRVLGTASLSNTMNKSVSSTMENDSSLPPEDDEDDILKEYENLVKS